MDMIVQGLIAAATVLWLLSYFGFRRVFGAIMVVDLVVTIGFIVAFSGSYAGMMTGVIAGMLTSMFLRIGRSLVGYSTPRFIRRSGDLFPSVVWVRRYK